MVARRPDPDDGRRARLHILHPGLAAQDAVMATFVAALLDRMARDVPRWTGRTGDDA